MTTEPAATTISHPPRRARARLVLAAVAVAVGSGAGLVTAAVTAAPAVAASPYGGTASAQLVTVDALDVPGVFDLANAAVAPASVAVSSDGGLTGGAESTADATNLDVNLLNGAIPLDNLLVSASQSAPPDHTSPTTKQLLSLPVNPLLDASVATASAQARAIPAGGCPAIGQPIAQSSSSLADAAVITGVLGASDTALVALDNAQGATVATQGSVTLQTVPGQSTDAVVSTATTQLTAITLLRGTPEAITINVLAPPTITATATGQAGGATVSYTEPVLQVLQGGKVLGTLDAKDADLTLPLGIGHLSLGTLTNVTQAANGTAAGGQAVLLDVALGGAGTPLPTLVNLAIAPLSASASVPSGGVVCRSTGPSTNPLSEVHKDLSATVAYPSTPFQYIVAIPNRGTCPLTSVVATDTVTGPAGSTISATAPTAASVNGLTTTWDVGTVAPNQTIDLLLTVTPPATLAAGSSYDNTVTVTGDCNGTPVSKTASIAGPSSLGARSPTGSVCSVLGSNKAASHIEVVPGESFDYYIHVFDTSAEPCDGVTVTDPLGPDVSFVSCTGGCQVSGSTVTWSLGTLAPGQSDDLSVTVDASDTAPAGTALPNAATIAPTNGAPQVVTTAGPTIGTTSVLAPPSPATPPPTSTSPTSTSPTTTSTSPTSTSPSTGSTSPSTSSSTGSTSPSTSSSSATTPVTEGASGAASPTSVHTGLWFAGSTPYLVGLIAFGLVLLGWPRLRRLLPPSLR
jgi:hypothetical protein